MSERTPASEPPPAARDIVAAVYAGDDDAVMRLLRDGAEAESTDEEGRTVLCTAATHNEAGIVRLLLAAGADPDRACGPQHDDLPLCGAAVWGHTAAVRALLAAGATPDRAEPHGATPLTWAVGNGRTSTVEALLEYGAASRTGTLREALEEARTWMARDVEQELRRGLLAGRPEAETVSKRIEEDGGTTVVVQVLRDGRPTAGNEQQTGHGAIATILEERLGVRTPYESLEERASDHGSLDHDEWIEAVAVLWRRGDEETFRAAAAGCASGTPLRQVFAAEVLGRLGRGAEAGGQAAGPFTARALPLLRELSREARDPELLQAVVLGLGHHGDPSVLPDVLRHAGDPDPGVRHRVAMALCGLVPGDHTEGIRTLITLSQDPQAPVRDWATTALACVDADSPDIRQALAARVADPEAETVAGAAACLAPRRDPRAEDALARLLTDEDPASRAHGGTADAVRLLRDELLWRRLEGSWERRP